MLKRTLLGLALCLALPLAQADTASLRYSNLQVSLEDLDTTDSYQPDQAGVDRLLGDWLVRSTSATVSRGAEGVHLDVAGGVTHASLTGAGVRGEVSADRAAGTLQSWIDVSSPSTSYQSFLFGLGYATDDGEIALAPHTRLTVSLDTEATGQLTAKCWAGTRCSFLNISPSLRLDVWTASGEEGALFGRPSDYYDVTLKHESLTSFSRSQQLSVTFENNTEGWLYATPYSDFYFMGSVAAVPEPQTWALTVAGLAVLGGMARRRRHGLEAQRGTPSA